ncbi:uncharacterized protein MYCGRDRAFT_96644 [Zymoseptoria tritici IPO323]|uniref:BTB domain-containing protein n=1 Tax=Zymoseptoria tritici (strain CBS 115943 / IPO323) TaxID=336722 RepID=F9XN18_ZYMTI|nr:uncharacterized protein MYCGRDRAFT_96644 [Zymoseptoria tritici IPO323]EGP83335.1 hypothetical protein MYCGRDRAFT_96644 [Zymoseptoria tritici IPO323]
MSDVRCKAVEVSADCARMSAYISHLCVKVYHSDESAEHPQDVGTLSVCSRQQQPPERHAGTINENNVTRSQEDMARIEMSDFDNDQYSDVIVKIYVGVDEQSDCRTFRCHKLVLGKESDFFEKAFNKNSRFADANSDVCKLFEHNLDVMEAYLKGRYRFAPSNAETADWEFMLELAHIASRYRNSKEARHYWHEFRCALKNTWENARATALEHATEVLKKLLLS